MYKKVLLTHKTSTPKTQVHKKVLPTNITSTTQTLPEEPARSPSPRIFPSLLYPDEEELQTRSVVYSESRWKETEEEEDDDWPALKKQAPLEQRKIRTRLFSTIGVNTQSQPVQEEMLLDISPDSMELWGTQMSPQTQEQGGTDLLAQQTDVGETQQRDLDQVDASYPNEELISALTSAEGDLSPRTPASVMRGFKVTKHIRTNRKKRDWSLRVSKPNVVIGDSNLGRIQGFRYTDLQIDSYPGATFLNVLELMRTALVQTEVKQVLLSFGINSRNCDPKATSIRQLLLAVRETKKCFPQASIYIAQINYSSRLTQAAQRNLAELNTYIRARLPYLPLLPAEQFETGPDNVHWTSATAKNMLEHWARALNFEAPQK